MESARKNAPPVKKMALKILTIGVYGFVAADFFGALLSNKVDVFCDIRQRRGVRGARYAFVNSKRLQNRLDELGIGYVHIKDLAPTKEIRQLQKTADQSSRTKKRERSWLSDAFIEAYQAEILAEYSPQAFLEEIGEECEVVVLFCVEREPEACHRMLAANYLASNLDLEVEHIRP